jgi:2-polyprenyl-3-methyl-5-hydroxy-6-metoxy-1,4-benzoquinol methylase
MNHHTRFDTAAATYNHHATLQHKIGDSLVSYVELPIKGTVLDFGCGTGHLTRKLVSTTTSVIGYDQSESMINVAKNESRTESECRWTSCLTDAERYAPFDFIISGSNRMY